MFEKVSSTPNLVAGEHDALRFWRETTAFEKLRAQNTGKPRWSFLDGPITANNPMGVHHAWGRTLKDAFQRYFAMTGHEQRYQNGFDCQGLWVEVEVERELGFKTKRDIEAYGLEQFINRCKERVRKFSAIQTEQSIRLGYWMDWNNSYYTMSDENNYTIWTFLKKCHQRGLIYKGLDAMPWCPRCGTGISEQERREGYASVEDESVYVRFPLRARPGESLLLWTTTPWTLAANVAAAVHPDLKYLRIRQQDHVYYLAQGRLDVLRAEEKKRGPAEVLAELQGRELVGWQYDGPFDELEAAAPARAAHRVIAWSDVTETEGTGIVHIAPGCGKEDFDLSKQLGLPVIAPIDDAGVYVAGFGFLTGRFAGQVAPEVYRQLQEKGLFYKAERYVHDYPHCWRCGTPLLFRAVDEWYISMSWRDEIKEIVDQIRWIPDYGHDLELDWLTNMGDWMISKKRYWGLALPIFECHACGNFDVIGSREELQARAIAGWDEFVGDPAQPNSPHRPWVDAVKIACSKCGRPTSRIPDVGNPWLDAGIVAYSTVRYNTDRQYWSQWIPADLVLESFPGQFRNWFYAMLAMSTMMERIPPFRTLLGHALVRDEHGEEMHKSKGNAIWFDDAAEKMGVDVMRWIYCRQNVTQNLNFGYGIGKQVERQVFNTLWNSYAFFVNYARLDQFDPRDSAIPVAERPEIDRWILSNLQLLVQSARRNFEDYAIAPVVRQAEEFIEDLSNWYIRRNRRRFWRSRGENDRDKLAAYQTLYEVMFSLAKLLAPIIPFLTERMYQNLVGRQWAVGSGQLESGSPSYQAPPTGAAGSRQSESSTQCSVLSTQHWGNPNTVVLGAQHRAPPAGQALGGTADHAGSELDDQTPVAGQVAEAGPEGSEGPVAPEVRGWEQFVSQYREGSIVTGVVTQKIRGGVLVDIGVKAFLPASQVDIHRPAELADYVGKTIQCVILKIDELRHNIVLSRRKLIESQVQGQGATTTGSRQRESSIHGPVPSTQYSVPNTPHGSPTVAGALEGTTHHVGSEWDDPSVAATGESPAGTTHHSPLTTHQPPLTSHAPLPESVHHCTFPEINAALIDEPLSFQMRVVQQVVACGHALREQAAQRVRQPLAEIRVATADARHRAALKRLGGLVTDELNIKQLTIVDSLGDLSSVSAKANFAALGPRYGKDVQKLASAIARAPADRIQKLQSGQSVTIEAGGRSFEIGPADVSIQVTTQPGWLVAPCGELQVAINAQITPELRREGLARDVVRHIQQLRKDTGLNIEDRIEVAYRTDDAELAQAIEEWSDYIMAETLCTKLVNGTFGLEAKEVQLGKTKLWLELCKSI